MNGGWRIEPRENPMQAMNVGIGFDCPKVKRP
jgi:hypothetical protein